MNWDLFCVLFGIIIVFPSIFSITQQRRWTDTLRGKRSSSPITFLEEDGRLALLSSGAYHDRQGRSPSTYSSLANVDNVYEAPSTKTIHQKALMDIVNPDTRKRDIMLPNVSTYTEGKPLLIGILSNFDTMNEFPAKNFPQNSHNSSHNNERAKPRQQSPLVNCTQPQRRMDGNKTEMSSTITNSSDEVTRSLYNTAHLKIVNSPKGSHNRRGVDDPQKSQPPDWSNNHRPSTPKTRFPDNGRPSITTESGVKLKPSSEIVFPGPQKHDRPYIRDVDFIPKIGTKGPICAKGSTFCTEVTENDPIIYPAEYLSDILTQETSIFKGVFGNDEIFELNVTQRIDAAIENPLCMAREQLVYPKMAQNADGKWKFVVNQEQFIQGVRVETCMKKRERCMFTESFPLGYKTECKQKYIYRRMLSLDEDGQPKSDTFKLPSCCACFVKEIGVAARTGGINGKNPINFSPATVQKERLTT